MTSLKETLNCGALQWTNGQWQGDLHFPEGTIPVYLVKLSPDTSRAAYHIRDRRSMTTIGVLFMPSENVYYGRVNADPCVGLQGWITQSGRFVLRRKAGWEGMERYPVTLHYVPYGEGEAYRP